MLTNQKAIRNSQSLLDLSYNYQRNGSVGNLNGKTGHLTRIIDNLNNAKNREYEFDALGRLTKAKGGETGTLWDQQYSYDRYGNRTNVTASGVAADKSPIPLDGLPNLSYDNTSNRITTTGFEYDVAGNQIRALAANGTDWLLYEYDAANRLRVVKQDGTSPTDIQTFEYGSTNARLMALDYASNRWTIYAATGGTTLAEYTEFTEHTPTWTKSYTYLGDRLLSTVTPNGTGGEFVEFNHPDRLGIRLITNSAGSYEQAHLPFGTALNAESTGSINRRFTSYDRSSITGLDYALNRTYDSKLGRFTQIDPIGIKATDINLPQTLNLYAYCGNDPVNHTDPDGLFWGFFKKLFKGIGKALSIIGSVIATVLSNKWVSMIITVLSIAVPAFSVLKALNVIKKIPSIITFAAKALKAINYIGIIGKTSEITSLLFEGKFAQLGRVLGTAFLGALVGVIEDSIVNGVLESIRGGNFSLKGIMKGAWKGFKNGLGYVKEALARFGSKKWWEGFAPIYGFFCAPGWGIQASGNTGSAGQRPADGVDSICQRHDQEMKEFETGLRSGSKTPRDWAFIKDTFFASVKIRLTDIALGGRYASGEVYRAFIPIAFGSRIVLREVRR